MTRRFTKLPIAATAFLVGGLLIGAALAPVAAQNAPADGQVAVRSDGSVYLISGGQRRWVATVAITDDELNAYPEGEPIYSGLAPIGGPTTASAPPAAQVTGSPTTGSAPAASTPSTSAPSTTAAAPASGGGNSQVDPSLPIEVDIDGKPTFEPGERIIAEIKTSVGANCELAVKWPDGTEVDQAKMTADSRGRCRYSIEIASNAAAGTGSLKGIVRQGDKTSRQDVEFEVIAPN